MWVCDILKNWLKLKWLKNTSKNLIKELEVVWFLMEESCVCNWIIFVKNFQNSTISVEISICLVSNGNKEDKMF